jgi:hypothetical protein
MSYAVVDAPGQDDAAQTASGDIRHLSAGQLRMLGMARVAYMSGLRAGDGTVEYAIHGADGGTVAIVDDLEVALDLVERLGVTLVPVH